jgi:hypothetical protein
MTNAHTSEEPSVDQSDAVPTAVPRPVYAVQEPGDSRPFGIARIGSEPGSLQLWTRRRGWIDAQVLAGYFVGGERGLRLLSDAEAARLMDDPTIGAYTDGQIELLRMSRWP